MIFVFAEDATLHVVADIDAVRVICEPIDAESSVCRFYNAEGRPLNAVRDYLRGRGALE